MGKQNKVFTNKEIAEILRSIAATYLLKNENRFRIIAYEKAADTVEHMTREMHDIWQEGGLAGLQKVQGIGPTISSHLDELFTNGVSKHFQEVTKDIPASVFVLMRVAGIGPKKAFKLVQHFKFHNADTVLRDLKKAAEENRIASLETFGKKSQEDILESLKIFENSKQRTERMPLPYAGALAQEIEEYMRQLSGIIRIDFLGSLRRKVSTIGDIDIAIATDKKNSNVVVEHFKKFRRAISINNSGEHKASIIISPNIRVDLRVQNLKTYGSMLQYFTGSKAHNVKLREYAIKKGLSLNEYGIKNVKTGKVKVFDSEEEFYNFIGLDFIPPEIREGTNEIQLALQHTLPHLVEVQDIKGDLHIHSSYDLQTSHDIGANTYAEIVAKAKERKYEYVGFADHNPRTSNNTENDIIEIMKKRKEYIDKSLKNVEFPYFIGLEVDIDPNGKLALPEKAIEYVDYLIVSVHSSFRQNKTEATNRVLKALSYPKVKIFGHPTGRLLGKRDGLEYDWEKIYSFVKEKNIALEINSGPDRLDLPDSLVREAGQSGVKFVIDTDAHHIDWMDGINYGVAVARRGWATKNDIINTKGLKEFKSWITE